MAVTITQTANPGGVTATSNIATYSSVSIGTAAPNRIVVVLVGSELASSTPSGCTIDFGSGDTAMTAGTGGNFGAVYAQTYRLLVPTGTTATIKVTYSSTNPTNVQNHIAVYSVTDAAYSSAGGDGSTDMDATDPLTTGSTTIPAGGGMIAVAARAGGIGGQDTWANLTEDLDVDGGSFGFTTAYSTTAGTATRTCTAVTTGEDGAMSWLIFADNTSPTVALNSPADASSGSDTTPTFEFTGSDTNSDDIRYNIQISPVNGFGLTVDATSNSGEGTAISSDTWSHTVGGINRILVVGVNARGLKSNNNTEVTGVTYNGVALTKIRHDQADGLAGDDDFRARSELWYLIAPDTGAHDIVVTWSGAIGISCCGAISLNGAIQSTDAIDSHNGQGANADTTPSANVTVVEENCYLIDTIFTRASPPLTKDASQTLIFNVDINGGGDSTGMSYKSITGTGSQAMAWTAGAEESALSVVAIAPIPFLNKVSGTDSGFANPDVGGDTDPFTAGDNIQFAVQAGDALSAGTYYWRVRGIDPSGSNTYGAWATARSFTVTAGGTVLKDMIGGFIPFAR